MRCSCTYIGGHPDRPFGICDGELEFANGEVRFWAPASSAGQKAFSLRVPIGTFSGVNSLGSELTLALEQDRGTPQEVVFRLPDPEVAATFVTALSEFLPRGSGTTSSGSNEDDEADEDERRALRMEIVEAMSAAGWDVTLSGDEVLLGDGRVNLVVLPRRSVLLYATLFESHSELEQPDALNESNLSLNYAAYFMHYESASGRECGVFQRFRVSEPTPSSEELARWLTAQVRHVLLLVDVVEPSAP